MQFKLKEHEYTERGDVCGLWALSCNAMYRMEWHKTRTFRGNLANCALTKGGHFYRKMYSTHLLRRGVRI